MAITEEEIKLILNTQDSRTQVHALATEVEFLTGRMERLAKEFNEGAITEAQYVKLSRDTGEELRKRAALTEEVARSVGALEKSHQNLGNTTLQASYAIQDFTSQLGDAGLGRALGSIQNNIPGILQGLGVGAGLTGVISVLAVGLGAALPKIQEFFGAMDAEKVKAAAEELKKVQAEAEAMLKGPPDDPAKKTREALGKYDQQGMGIGGAVLEALRATDREMPTGREQQQLAMWQMGQRGPIFETLGVSISPETLEAQLQKRTQARATELIGQLGRPGAEGRAARDKLKALATANPRLFPNDFVKTLADVEPDSETAQTATAMARERGIVGMLAEDETTAFREDEAKKAQAVKDMGGERAGEALIGQDQAKRVAEFRRRARERQDIAEHGVAERKRLAREAEAEARKTAREADPTNIEQAEARRLEDRVTAIGRNLANAGELGNQTPQSLRQLAGRVVQELPNSGGDIAQLFREVAFLAQQKMRREQLQEAQRQRAMSNMRGAP